MIFKETELAGAFIIELERHQDERGFFARAWCKNEFEAHGLSAHWVQTNIALSKKRGTLRGLHYQAAPYGEAKLMRCVKGAIYDVIVDLRPGSPTWGEWLGVELTADNGRALYVPQGFAHGYQALVDDTVVLYPVSQFYMPGFERGVRWNDPALGIEWPILEDMILSDKDRSWSDHSYCDPVSADANAPGPDG
jgi:dTDP-4-dehydrorhamnose 3,5-epimerase